jgi:hypothetical protein
VECMPCSAVDPVDSMLAVSRTRSSQNETSKPERRGSED